MRRLTFVLSYCFLAACGCGIAGAVLGVGHAYFVSAEFLEIPALAALGAVIGVLWGLVAGIRFKF